MALLNFKPKADIWTGIAIGAGLLLAPVVVPMIAAAARPILKTLLKEGLILVEKGNEMIAEATEVLEDLIAEVRAEVDAELAEADEECVKGTGDHTRAPMP
jgi:hypothetical protein